MTYIDYAGLDDDGEPILNEYSSELEYEIDLWISDSNITKYHEEAIEYVLSIRKKIIDSLNYDNSEVDLSKVKLIKDIDEGYILPAIDCYVEGTIIHGFKIPKIVTGLKQFKYRPKIKNNIKRGKSPRTINRYLKVYELSKITQKRHDSWTRKEIYQDISTKNIDGKRYNWTTVRDIIEKKKYLDTYEDK